MGWGVRQAADGADGADVIVRSGHELRIYGAISTRDVMVRASRSGLQRTRPGERQYSPNGAALSLADDSLLTLTGPDDILVEGSIFVRGENSGLYIESNNGRVKFATSFVEVEDGIEVIGNGQTEDLDRVDPLWGGRLRSSVLVEATAVIQSFAAGSDITITGAHDIDLFGSIVAGGSIGPEGVTWSGPNSEVNVVAGEQVYL